MTRSADRQHVWSWFGRRVPASPHVRSSATSRSAARRIHRNAPTLEGLVFAAVLDAGPAGMTDGEVQDALRISGDTERPRRVRLVELGIVHDSGVRRRTRSGRKAVVVAVNHDQESAA